MALQPRVSRSSAAAWPTAGRSNSMIKYKLVMSSDPTLFVLLITPLLQYSIHVTLSPAVFHLSTSTSQPLVCERSSALPYVTKANFGVGAGRRARRNMQDAAELGHRPLHFVGEKTDVVDAELRFVTFDAVVKGMNGEIGFAVGAEAVAAPLLAAQVARRDFAQAENLCVKKEHRFRVKRAAGAM